MSFHRPTRHVLVAAVAVAIVAFLGVFGGRALTATSSATSASPTPLPGGSLPALSTGATPPLAVGVAGGDVPDGTTVYDEGIPAVANLDGALLGALRQAADDAAGEGVGFEVNSGWRSPEYQEQLLEDATSRYGSAVEAARWVATPTTSAHVSGDAVDLGGAGTTDWLARRGAAYGLCQVYDNEPWHFELRPAAVTEGCPTRYADPTQDPRMAP